MTEPVQADHSVEITVGLAQRPNGDICVVLTVTTCGIAMQSVAMDPDMAAALGPQLAKELEDASQAAKAHRRSRDGLIVVPGLPDTLREG